MSEADHQRNRPAGLGGALRAVVRALLALAILGAGVYAALWFNWTEGKARRGADEAESARLVETVTVERRTTRVAVRAMGTVVPAREVTIQPRVSGKLVEQSDSFVPGGHFDAGQFMLQIDRTDYRYAIRQRKSDLQEARATLEIRKGDQAVAREELELLKGDIPDIDRDLILRKPQVNQARAAVQSAEAALEQARTDLNRTRIEAPFDGQIVSRSVTAGNNVSQGQQLAVYVGSDKYWVRASVPVTHLRWVRTPAPSGKPGSPARITHDSAWGEDAGRDGRVARLIGRLEENSRMAELLISVTDPLAQNKANRGKPRLILDSFVDVRIKGRRLEDVIVIDRSYLRDDGIVWVMNGENRLEIKPVETAFRGKERAYIRSGLDDGDRVVKTNLAAPVEGMLLEPIDNAERADAPADGEEDGGDE